MVENINWTSFGAGVAVGVGATVAFNRASKFINEMGSGEEKPQVQAAAQESADRGYLRQLLAMAQKAHLFSHKLELRDIILEPHFIRPPDLVKIPDEDADITRSVFEVIPRVYDYPYLHAPYNIPNIEIDDLGRGDGALALIGTPGSGRTTALMAIALWSSGFLEFEKPDDAVAKQLRELEDDLTPAEQAERVKKRVALMERARQRFAEARAEKGDGDSETDEAVETGGTPLGQVDAASSRFRQLAPIYVHLANVVTTSGEYGLNVDPAEPLVRALQADVGWVTSKRLVGKTYKLLEKGQALVLIDGYDDLPHNDRPAIMAWLKEFITLYKDNFIIVTMPPNGYGPLMEVGVMPVYLRPWYDQIQKDMADKFSTLWDKFSEQAIDIDRDTYRTTSTFFTTVGDAARGRNALDTTLQTWSFFSGLQGNESEQMDAYLRDVLPEAPDLMEQLTSMAAIQLDEGYITQKRLIAQAMERELANLSKPKPKKTNPKIEEVPAPPAEDELPDLYAHLDDSSKSSTDTVSEDGNILADVPEEELTEEEKAVVKQQRQISNELSKLLKKLLEVGLLQQFRGGRYQFRHPMLTAYLAARFVEDADPFTLLNKHANPNWEHALCYLAQMRDIDFIVAQELSQVDMDILHESILKMTRWLRYSGTEVVWRNNLLRYLGNILLANNQFTLVRERVAAALLGMRDEGVLVIFRRAVGHPNPDIRRLACLGLGVLRDSAAIQPLTTRVLQDDNIDVSSAAALALSIIGTPEAFDAMLDVFEMSNEREVRRAIAESLATNREEGYPTLFEAVRAQDMLTRRSAVFGLGRVRADWALITLNEVFLEDSEFYVRLAAESVFTDIYEASLKGVNPYPTVTKTPWLNEWVQEQIEMGLLPMDIDPETFLDTAFMQEEDPFIRLLATQTMGQLGLTDRIGDLYGTLRDQTGEIRDAGYRALGEFQQRMGKPLPAPLPYIKSGK